MYLACNRIRGNNIYTGQTVFRTNYIRKKGLHQLRLFFLNYYARYAVNALE